jgi:hypothetical protein
MDAVAGLIEASGAELVEKLPERPPLVGTMGSVWLICGGVTCGGVTTGGRTPGPPP